MSIINDALKKAGQPIIASQTPEMKTVKSSTANPGAGGMKPRIEVYGKKSRINWGPLFVIAILVMITAPIAVPMLQGPTKTVPGTVPSQPAKEVSVGMNAPSSGSLASVTSNMKAQFGVEEIPAINPSAMHQTPKNPIGNFSLSGIVYSQGGSYCLINGKVLKQGEQVSGARIDSISERSVTLDLEGRKITLQATS